MFFFLYFLSQLLKPLSKDTLLLNTYICLSFFLIPISVTTRACSWFTGSFYYLWPTLALLCYMKPFVHTLFNKAPSKKEIVLALIGGFYTGFMEQTAAIALCFALMLFLYFAIKKVRFSPFLFLPLLANSICLVCYYLSPGNKLRFTSEVATWYPSFETLSLVAKAIQGINWTHTHLIKETSLLLLFLSLMTFLLVRRNVGSRILSFICFLPSLYFIGILLPINRMAARTTSFEYNYDIEAVLDKLFFNPMLGILPSILGLAVILFIGILIFLALESSEKRYFCLLLYLAALASGYVLGFSPTIFASGPRIFFSTDLFLVLINGIILLEVLAKVTLSTLFKRLIILCYSFLALINACMYIGGIIIKSLFKIL